MKADKCKLEQKIGDYYKTYFRFKNDKLEHRNKLLLID